MHLNKNSSCRCWSLLLLSRNPRNAYSLLLGLYQSFLGFSWFDESVWCFRKNQESKFSLEKIKCFGLTGKEGDILVSHCLLLARFFIFSRKYKGSKPALYNWKTKYSFSIIKGTEKTFEEKRIGKNYSEKTFIRVNSPFFPCILF